MRSFALALGFIALAASPVAASMPLCLNPAGPTVDVPPNPRFLVERHVLDRFTVHDGALRRPRRVFPHSVEPIDAYYAWVAVEAAPGAKFRDTSMLGAQRCVGRTFRVVQNWRRPQVSAEPTLASDDDGLHLAWSAKAVAWLQIDRAYSVEALERGLFARTIVAPDRPFSRMTLPAGDAPSFVRTVVWFVDGTQGPTWEGWVRPPRRAASDATPAAVAATRTVPVDPTFVVHRSDRPRYAAIADDGTLLPTSLEIFGSYNTRITVRASAGTAFRLHRTPIRDPAVGPRFEVTTDRRRDAVPTVRGFSASTNIFGMTIAVDVDGAPWDSWEIAWARSRRELGRADLLADRGGVVIDTLTPTMSLEPERLVGLDEVFIRLTPVWPNGDRGTAWEGRVDLGEDPDDPRQETKELAFERLPPIVARCGTVVVAAQERQPEPARERTWALLALLALGLFASAGLVPVSGSRAAP